MVMPSNHSSPAVHYMAGAYPTQIGWLVGPSARTKTKMRPWMPYALDNDAFSAWTHNKPWDVVAWRELLSWASSNEQPPLWALVPDQVADRDETLRKWSAHSGEVRCAGLKPAFAVQDGMTAKDVPHDAEVVFVGGTTDWKWSTLAGWAEMFPWIHVGRVNSVEKLEVCADLGVKSVDGTGWFRDESCQSKIPALLRWMELHKITQQI